MCEKVTFYCCSSLLKIAFYREGCQKRSKKRGVVRHTFLALYVMLSCRNSRLFWDTLFIYLRGAPHAPRKAGQLVIVLKVFILFQELWPFARHRRRTSNLISMFPLPGFKSSSSFRKNVLENFHEKYRNFTNCSNIRLSRAYRLTF